MSTLSFEKIRMNCGEMGPESTVPDILGQINVQNRTQFHLDEDDEIYEGYGQRPNGYPYRQQNLYTRELKEREIDAAILENDSLRAVFLPGFGGRLWQLYDKKSKRDVLYTNDCLRASNLAIRNAWVSGGSEWNCGVIGHNPFTMDDIFASRFEKDGMPVLRMYAYERIRGVVYQMDFWLDEEAPALNCHMAVHNPAAEVVPMYWWTNIASPLYPDGRLLVEAHKAYSYNQGAIRKVNIPCPEQGVDVSKYETIPSSRDFFFAIDKGKPRWIANLDKTGYGMLHSSSDRLQSRKLFVWGQRQGSQHWQRFLTENGGPYIEVQAGLGKTQYGCIPMAPHTTWEWSERFEPLQLTVEQRNLPFDEASALVSERICASGNIEKIEALGHEMLREPSVQMHKGSGDAALQDKLREKKGDIPVRPYLDFSSDDPRQDVWKQLLQTGVLAEPQEGSFPAYDPIGIEWLDLLKASLKKPAGENWYTYYCIALLEREAGRMDLARKALNKSIKQKGTASNYYAKAVFQLEEGKPKKASDSLVTGLDLGGRKNISYAKATVQLLVTCKAWKKAKEQIENLAPEIRKESRIQLCYIQALSGLGRSKEALDLLEADGGFVLNDVREGEVNMGRLWRDLHEIVTGEKADIPHQFDFDATGRG